MTDTTCHMSISLDGYVAGPDQSRDDPLGKRGIEVHGWHIGDPRATEADRIATGDHVSVMVRPERLRVVPDEGEPGAAGRSVSGTVTQLIFQGATARLHVELANGTELVSTVDPDDDIGDVRPGRRVIASWPPGAAHVLAGWPQQAGATSTDVDRVEASL